jgi:hypothetical protein
MEIKDWTPFWKIDADDRTRCMAQQTYEPLINPEHTVFCANYDWQNAYQKHEDSNRILYTKEVTEYFFEIEVYHLLKYKDKPYTPTILDIDQKNKRIFFSYNNETCNEIIYSNRNLSNYCPNWKDQLKHILTDLHSEGTYKLTMYPHCHFIQEGQLKAIDWYGCIPVNDPFIDAKYMDGIIHETAKFRLAETGELMNGKYNLELMFKGSLGTHVKWGDDSMDYIYKEIFNG